MRYSITEYRNRSAENMKRKATERGQAITEFVTCLIGMVFVFLGLLVIAILSMENVRCVLDARSEVDVASSQGTSIGGKAPEPILEWDWGKDEIPFTADDSTVSGALPPSYAQEFNTQKNSITDATVSESTPADPKDRLYINPLTLSLLEEHGYADGRAAYSDFLSAANLNGATVTVRDPLSKRGLPDLEKLLRSFTGNAAFTLEDSVYMPVRVD